MSIDKRRDPRFETNQELWCEGQTRRLEARNMSKSGMFLVADGKHDVGEQLQVSFEDGGDKIELQMEVMWCGKPEGGAASALGVRIVGFGKGEHAYERFVSRHIDQTEPARDEAGGDRGAEK